MEKAPPQAGLGPARSEAQAERAASEASKGTNAPSGVNRIACLLVPELPLSAELRAHPELIGRPLAIAAAPGPRAEIVAVSPEAARAGVRTFTSVVHGRATCAALVVRVLSPARDRAARDALLDAALSASPRAEHAPPGNGAYAAEAAVFVDARGVGALFHSEAGFAGALAERARRLGLPARVAVASSRSVAQIAARQLAYAGAQRAERAKEDDPGDVRVIAAGEESRFLAPLPLDLLSPDDAEAEALSRLGLRRVEDLLRLPERALVTRLGPGIRSLLALARGRDRAPPPSVPPAQRLEEASDLEAPLEQLEPLGFVLRGLLDRLAERLACRGLAFGDLELELRLEGGGHDARRVGIAAPTLELRVVLRLALLALEAAPPAAAVETVSVATRGAAVRGDQLDFFRPAGPTPTALARTLAELVALVGPSRVGAPAVADDHQPGAYRVEPFRAPGPRGTQAAPGPGTQASPGPGTQASPALTAGLTLAVRALRPPLPARVRVAGGRPAWLESALANGRIERSAGPWRSSGRWWSLEERFAFDHYDVATGDGWVVRLRLDLLRQRWEIDGVYD